MLTSLFAVTILLTLPYGVLALAAPVALFAQLGLRLDAAGAFVARGYGATLVAYGSALYLGRRSGNTRTVRALVISLVLFNALDAVIQGAGAIQGIAASVVFGTAIVHAVVAALSAVALVKLQG